MALFHYSTDKSGAFSPGARKALARMGRSFITKLQDAESHPTTELTPLNFFSSIKLFNTVHRQLKNDSRYRDLGVSERFKITLATGIGLILSFAPEPKSTNRLTFGYRFGPDGKLTFLQDGRMVAECASPRACERMYPQSIGGMFEEVHAAYLENRGNKRSKSL